MAKKLYQTGDVIWAPDAYHDDDPFLAAGGIRPWLIVSTGKYPNQGEDYLCCAVTSNARASDHLVPLDDKDWSHGPPRVAGQIDPQTVTTVKSDWIVRYSGRLATAKVNRARNLLKGYL